ncbi:NAD(P)/FAD-dependent oxidoreductase [Micrococcaceae bacterium Sec5.1]
MTVVSSLGSHHLQSEPSQTELDTIIVGAGFAGLGMGIQLARRQSTSFVILERASNIGGSWRDNTYPGVACDIPSHLYSFSFRPNAKWSKFFADGSEIQQYLHDSVLAEGLTPHLRLETEVIAMHWDERSERWSIITDRGEYRSKVLIIAAGRLSAPKIPDIQGLETFTGPIFHTARWDHLAELQDKRIGVVGTGASAVQLIPEISRLAKRLVIFQRSAPYVVPRNNRHYPDFEQRVFERDPVSIQRLRSRLFWKAEIGFAERVGEPGFVDKLRNRALQHLAKQVQDPQLRESLTPDYEIGCKRVLLSDDFYPALASPGVTVEPTALQRVDGEVAIGARGKQYELDALVLATGFQAAEPPFAHSVFGRDGLRLADHWSRGMTSYASTMVHGFPNMFVINGPNASLGHNSAIYMIETQIEFILRALGNGLIPDEFVLEVTRDAEDAYTEDIDSASASTVWINGGCESWYVDARSHRLTLLWPDFAHSFRERIARSQVSQNQSSLDAVIH